MMRDKENNYLELCLSVLNGDNPSSLNQDEANVIHLASSLLVGSYPKHSKKLEKASLKLLESKKYKKITAQKMVKSGKVVSLPRFKSMLVARLKVKIK